MGSACPCPRRLDFNSRPKRLLKTSFSNCALARLSQKFNTGWGIRNPAITLEVFSHWFKDADTSAVDRFAQGFGKPEEKWAKKWSLNLDTSADRKRLTS
jgi:hypothetical protein